MTTKFWFWLVLDIRIKIKAASDQMIPLYENAWNRFQVIPGKKVKNIWL